MAWLLGFPREDYEKGRVRFSEVRNRVYRMVEPMVFMHLRSGAMMYELKFWREKPRSLDSLYGMLMRLSNQNYVSSFASALTNFHEFCILKSAHRDFLISDQFLVSAALSFKARFVNATNRTIGQKDVLVLLPLSKSYYLCFYNGNKPGFIRPNQLRHLSSEQTDMVNRAIMNNSYIQTAGPLSDSLNRVLQYYDQAWPTAVYYGGNGAYGGAELRKEVFFYESDKEIYDFIESANYGRYIGIHKGDQCPCGSGLIFRDCCRYKVRAFKRFMDVVGTMNSNPDYAPHSIPGCTFRESNISEW